MGSPAGDAELHYVADTDSILGGTVTEQPDPFRPPEPVRDDQATISFPQQQFLPPPQPYQQVPQQYQQLPQPAAFGYYGFPAPMPVTQQNNGMATASMVLGIVGLFLSWFLFGIPSILAVIFGHIALKRSKGDATQAGRGQAIAGLTMGYVTIGIWASIFFVFILGAFVSA